MSSSCSSHLCFVFFFNDTATTEIYTLSLHDALPIRTVRSLKSTSSSMASKRPANSFRTGASRSEEHTSELQSRPHLVCRLLLEKKKQKGRALVIGSARHCRRAAYMSCA